MGAVAGDSLDTMFTVTGLLVLVITLPALWKVRVDPVSSKAAKEVVGESNVQVGVPKRHDRLAGGPRDGENLESETSVTTL